MVSEDFLDTLDLIAERESWMSAAACREYPDAVFFPGKGQTPTEAMDICSGCPVRDQCLDFAMRTDTAEGVWGGAYFKRGTITKVIPELQGVME
jgi:hypothetical protein